MTATQQNVTAFSDLKKTLKTKILGLKDVIRPYGKPVFIYPIEIPCEKIDILSWVETQKSSQKIYWASRQKELEIGGLGCADQIQFDNTLDLETVFEHIYQRFNQLNPNLRYYGGMCFDEENLDDTWKSFGKLQFFVPQFELITEKETTTFVCNVPYHNVHKEGLNEIIKKLDLIDFDNLDKNTSLETPKSREDQPTREEWKSLFSDTKENLKDTKLEKLVLARKSLFTFNGALNGFTIKKKLRDTTPECYHFCFQPEENVCFMGASPERFYKREGNKILSEAIAGTRPRGKSNEEDLTLKKELLQSSKDLNEHKLVVDAISQSLNDLCENINSDTTPSVLELCGAYHLKTSFEGTIKDTTEDIDLIQQLHPTPAVAGYPKKEALNFIAKKESFSRGWYAGLFGYIGQNVTEFTVAIRSGLIKNNTISLFAGAGIVSESEETQEWDEIENKMNQFFSVFKNETTT